MGGAKREEGVLKLVRPGGIVEIHKTTITAAQVMEMYPRHCVTRPDVFKYPWIVVRPESILSLGRVFYVVPRHTIWRLLQKNGLVKGNHTLPKPPQESNDTTSYDEVVSSSRKHYKDRAKSGSQPLIEASSFRKLARVSPQKISSQKDDEKSKAHLKPKFPESYLFKETLLPTNQNNDPILKEVDNSLMMIKHKAYGSYADDDDDVQGCFPMRRNASNLEAKKKSNASKGTTSLKPCLKKHRTTTNTKMSTGPRVRFMIPQDYHDEKEGAELGGS